MCEKPTLVRYMHTSNEQKEGRRVCVVRKDPPDFKTANFANTPG